MFHWQTAKRISRCIKGMLDKKIFYLTTNKMELIGYTDSDWASDTEERKSASDYVFNLG